MAEGKFTEAAADFGRVGNGLMCYECHGRLDLSRTESTGVVGPTTGNTAWLNCVTNGATVECTGDQRSCLTEERRRNDVVVEVKSMCKNPEACAYQWRRNQRYMPMFHHFGDQFESATPGYFDDECMVDGGTHKHGSNRAQWESTCRRCCAATVAGTGCNGPDATDGANMPMQAFCLTAACDGALLSANHFSGYSIMHLSTFMSQGMAHARAHPGEGRNSAPEDKFILRKDMNNAVLREQADQLSTEDTDFHNNRGTFGSINGVIGAFGS